MYAIGYMNRFRSFPAPVVLVVRLHTDFLFVYPTGYVKEAEQGLTMESFLKFPEFHQFLDPIFVDTVLDATCFAFGANNITIGTKNQVMKAVRTRLRRKTLSDDTRAKLSSFVNRS